MDFFFSENIADIGLPDLQNCCLHVLCTTGEGSLVYYDRCFHFQESDLLVLSHPEGVSNLALPPGTAGKLFAADYKFLQNQLPANNYSIGGSISLYGNPVISLSHAQAEVFLAEGNSRTERTVGWYARQLHVSEKYLSSTVKRLTGGSVMSYIDRHTVPILKEYLDNPRYSLTQIAERMNFASLSYFSRYCKKHLGMSPSEYRSSLQPQG